ncbi:protein transport protein Sec24B [Plasmodium sp. gorilla clade G2]|uniref:protein transport protein Sec24B n=1 Tax=Plasmodium sp. gorilla clade G2 TaxID=880535 RepID=UPI000D20DDF9|nr:protein transport protein Sec24B [Plasmodium sp. gorilla clade G2]SOV11183.1 protein transport protein Sec24B [Plasmodium sp. gorilla clade G2]
MNDMKKQKESINFTNMNNTNSVSKENINNTNNFNANTEDIKNNNYINNNNNNNKYNNYNNYNNFNNDGQLINNLSQVSLNNNYNYNNQPVSSPFDQKNNDQNFYSTPRQKSQYLNPHINNINISNNANNFINDNNSTQSNVQTYNINQTDYTNKENVSPYVNSMQISYNQNVPQTYTNNNNNMNNINNNMNNINNNINNNNINNNNNYYNNQTTNTQLYSNSTGTNAPVTSQMTSYNMNGQVENNNVNNKTYNNMNESPNIMNQSCNFNNLPNNVSNQTNYQNNYYPNNSQPINVTQSSIKYSPFKNKSINQTNVQQNNNINENSAIHNYDMGKGITKNVQGNVKSNDEECEDNDESGDKDSSSDEESSDFDNSVGENGEEIYTLIKKTYNRIDMNKIPRPIINFQDKKSRRNLKVYDTCKYISPPSYYQPYISIDTGKADPRFIKSTLYQLPLFSETLELSKIPFGIIVNPFACLNEGECVEKVDMKDVINDKEENIEILRCPKCYSYLHATILEDISKSVHCVFCDTEFLINENVLFDIYQYNEKMNSRMEGPNDYMRTSISPLLKGSVDILLPPIYYNSNNNVKLTYTYLNKNLNQAASMITNKIMSLTKQISNSLVLSDMKGENNTNDNIINNNMSSGSNNYYNDHRRSLHNPYNNSNNQIIYNEAQRNIQNEENNLVNYNYNSQGMNNYSYVQKGGVSPNKMIKPKDENSYSNIDDIINNFHFNMHDIKNIIIEKDGEPEDSKMKRGSFLLKYPQIKKCLPPYFIFVIECSYNSIYSNITHTILEGIRYAVQNVKCDKTKIAIITFNSSIYFYNCKKNKNNQVIVMSDIDNPFIPLSLDDLFFSCIDEKDKINNLIDSIKLFSNSCMQSYSSCGNSALKIAVDILKSRNGNGNVCMFYTSTPNCGLGCIKELKKRDIPENFLEVKEKIFYDALLLDLYSYNISVDISIIASNNIRICVPSLQYIAQNTGGNILFIQDFQWQKDYKEIYMNIKDTLTSENIAYCCELKLRYTHNIVVKNLFCCNNNFNSIISTDTIKIPKIRHDHTFAFLLNYSDMSETKKQVYIQCACIYTNLYGDRYVRLHTTHMNLTTSLSTVFRYTDAEALMNILIKQLCTNILHNDNYSKIIIDNLAAILYSYRLNCATSAHSGQLILPDTLKLLPLFTSCLLKHNVVKKDALHDLKVYNLIKLLSMPIISSLLFVYPVLYLIHMKGRHNEIDYMDVDDENFLPRAIPTSAEKVYSSGIYLLDSSTHMYLYFGYHCDPDFTTDIIGEMPTEENCYQLIILDNSTNAKKLQRIIANITRIHHFNNYVPLVVVPPKSSMEEHFISLCVEDKVEKEYSYVNFLCFIHKLVHKKIEES